MSIILMKSFLDTRYPWSPPEHNGKKEQSLKKASESQIPFHGWPPCMTDHRALKCSDFF